MMDYPDPIAITRDAVALAGSQTALARMTGIAQQSISKILSGQIDPRKRTLDKIAAILRHGTPAPAPGLVPGVAGAGESAVPPREEHPADAAAEGDEAPRPPPSVFYLPLTFEVHGDVQAWMRPQRGSGGYYTHPNVSAYAAAVGQEAHDALRRQLRSMGAPRPYRLHTSEVTERPVTVMVVATFRTPKARAGETYKTSKPDVDNVAKLVLDALSGVVYRDDAVVAQLMVSKMWGDEPMLRVTVDTAT